MAFHAVSRRTTPFAMPAFAQQIAFPVIGPPSGILAPKTVELGCSRCHVVSTWKKQTAARPAKNKDF
jgi:hypothetical protein